MQDIDVTSSFLAEPAANEADDPTNWAPYVWAFRWLRSEKGGLSFQDERTTDNNIEVDHAGFPVPERLIFHKLPWSNVAFRQELRTIKAVSCAIICKASKYDFQLAWFMARSGWLRRGTLR